MLPGQVGSRRQRQKTTGSDRRVERGDGAGLGESEWGLFEYRVQCVQAVRLLGIKTDHSLKVSAH